MIPEVAPLRNAGAVAAARLDAAVAGDDSSAVPLKSALATVVFCVLAAGCAGWTAERCAQTDWYRQGYMDGLRVWYSLIDEYNGACSAFGIKPDAARYKEGLDDGFWYVDHKPCAC